MTEHRVILRPLSDDWVVIVDGVTDLFSTREQALQYANVAAANRGVEVKYERGSGSGRFRATFGNK